MGYFDLWFKCVDYQRSSGRGKADKKSAVVVTLLQLSVEERRALVGVGISRLKESAFAEFKTEFAAFVKDEARRRRKTQAPRKTDAPTKSQETKKPAETSWFGDDSLNSLYSWGYYNPGCDELTGTYIP